MSKQVEIKLTVSKGRVTIFADGYNSYLNASEHCTVEVINNVKEKLEEALRALNNQG